MQFKASVNMIGNNITAMLDPDGEPKVALNNELRLGLFLLQQRIAALFAAEPLTDEEKETLAKREAADKQQQQQQAA